MLISEKYISRESSSGVIRSCLYRCDMCKKDMVLSEKCVVGVTELGRGSYKKKWDLCNSCIKILEKNVNTWYSRLEQKRKLNYNKEQEK